MVTQPTFTALTYRFSADRILSCSVGYYNDEVCATEDSPDEVRHDADDGEVEITFYSKQKPITIIRQMKIKQEPKSKEDTDNNEDDYISENEEYLGYRLTNDDE